MSTPETTPLLTLEPLLEAVREGVEAAGWFLSGLQKTTSHQFEGRWAGDSTRSAYLFFHKEKVSDAVSVDVFLDETSKGLSGNLALVVDGHHLGELEEIHSQLELLSVAARMVLPSGYRTPITVRLRLETPGTIPERAETECRFKLYIPKGALRAGHSAVSALASTAVAAFEDLLEHPVLRHFGDLD